MNLKDLTIGTAYVGGPHNEGRIVTDVSEKLVTFMLPRSGGVHNVSASDFLAWVTEAAEDRLARLDGQREAKVEAVKQRGQVSEATRLAASRAMLEMQAARRADDTQSLKG